MKKIGLTTTVPLEVLIAAGYTPVDLNNIFITDRDYLKYIDLAEQEGFPKSMCSWIKGIYGACIDNGIKEIVGVIEGDCSNTKALIEVLKLKGVSVYPFSFPNTHDLKDMKNSMQDFMKLFKVTIEEVEQVRVRLNKLRILGKQLDEITYKDCKVTGFENHLYQVNFSDCTGNIDKYERELKEFINIAKKREPINKKLRLGYIGVPPMTGDIYDYVLNFNAHFVFNEVQREFAFPRASSAKDIYEQYYDYTYPYDIEFRIEDLKKQIKERKIDGIIHYTQAFCYRAVEDIILNEKLDIPILNIEGDKLNKLDARTKLRIEAFLDMLLDVKEEAK